MYKESIQGIMEANKDDADIMEFIESRVNTFTEYVGHVSFMETRIQRLKIQGVGGDEWRDAIESLDTRRREKHNMAMAAAQQLNRLCQSSGLPLFYDKPIDHEHRNAVGDLCQTVVDEYFEGRHVRPLTMAEIRSGHQDFADAVTELDGQAAKEGLMQ